MTTSGESESDDSEMGRLQGILISEICQSVKFRLYYKIIG